MTTLTDRRTVERVPYVTSPGHRVSHFVSDLGVFAKDEDGRFVLVAVAAGDGTVAERIDVIRERCGWELVVADEVVELEPVTSDEVAALRRWDPQGFFLEGLTNAGGSGAELGSVGLARRRQHRQLVELLDPLGPLELRHAEALEPARGTRRGRRPRRPRTNAHTRSPRRSSGKPTATAWRTAGWASSTPSTSAAEMFSPPRMMMSLIRPTIRSHPSSSSVARSPVWNQSSPDRVGGPRRRRCSRRRARGLAAAALRPRPAVAPRRSRGRPRGVGSHLRRARRSSPARSGGSPACQVETTGASVDPYVRFTTAPNASPACSTNAGVTPAPPHEISRIVATASWLKLGAAIIVWKNVGGPIMNVTPSLRTRSTARSGDHRSMSTEVSPPAPGCITAFDRPEMWAIGAGIRTMSRSSRPWMSSSDGCLVVEGSVGVQHALGAAGGPGGEEDDRQVGAHGRRPRPRASASSSPSNPPSPRTSIAPAMLARGRARCRQHDHAGSTSAPRRADVGGGGQVVDRRGDRPESPAGAVEDDRLPPAGCLERDGVAATDTPGPRGRRPADGSRSVISTPVSRRLAADDGHPFRRRRVEPRPPRSAPRSSPTPRGTGRRTVRRGATSAAGSRLLDPDDEREALVDHRRTEGVGPRGLPDVELHRR